MLTESQLKDRASSIGGSDAAAIVNCDPYQTGRELFHVKRGEIEPDDLTDKEAVHFGNVLEAVVAEEYTRRTGSKVRRVNKTLTHPVHSFITGHIDRDVVGKPVALECKTSGVFVDGWGEEGTDQVPDQYLVQCQHYMALMPKIEQFDLAVLRGGQQFKIYHIYRDDVLIENLIAMEVEFWNRVQNNLPPTFQYEHKSTEDLLKKLYPGTNGQIIDLPNDLQHWHEVLNEANQEIKINQAVAKAAKRRILKRMGEASIGLLPDGGGYTRKEITRKGYTVDESTYVDFRFSKKPKGSWDY